MGEVAVRRVGALGGGTFPIFQAVQQFLFAVTLDEALRDVYRNMPYHEFSSFISFILRQLHAIRDRSTV